MCCNYYQDLEMKCHQDDRFDSLKEIFKPLSIAIKHFFVAKDKHSYFEDFIESISIESNQINENNRTIKEEVLMSINLIIRRRFQIVKNGVVREINESKLSYTIIYFLQGNELKYKSVETNGTKVESSKYDVYGRYEKTEFLSFHSSLNLDEFFNDIFNSKFLKLIFNT